MQQKVQRLHNRFNSLAKQSNSSESEFIDTDKYVVTFTEIPRNFTFRNAFLTNDCKRTTISYEGPRVPPNYHGILDG